MKLGMEGVGVYWCIVEMLYEENGYLQISEYERISYELQTKIECIKSVIECFDLFENDGENFWSESALNRLSIREEKSCKNRNSVNIRWNKQRDNQLLNKKEDTNVLQTGYNCNTIKERKGKEKKGNKEEIDKEIFKEIILKENLTELEISNTIEFIDRLKQVKLSNDQVLSFWLAFKLHQPQKKYQTENEYVKYFRDWLKFQVNGQKNNTNGNKQPISRSEALKNW